SHHAGIPGAVNWHTPAVARWEQHLRRYRTAGPQSSPLPADRYRSRTSWIRESPGARRPKTWPLRNVTLDDPRRLSLQLRPVHPSPRYRHGMLPRTRERDHQVEAHHSIFEVGDAAAHTLS